MKSRKYDRNDIDIILEAFEEDIDDKIRSKHEEEGIKITELMELKDKLNNMPVDEIRKWADKLSNQEWYEMFVLPIIKGK